MAYIGNLVQILVKFGENVKLEKCEILGEILVKVKGARIGGETCCSDGDGKW